MNIKSKPFVIAEAGVNHNGSLEIAKKLVIGYKFKTTSDTEVLLLAYHKWGAD